MLDVYTHQSCPVDVCPFIVVARHSRPFLVAVVVENEAVGKGLPVDLVPLLAELLLRI